MSFAKLYICSHRLSPVLVYLPVSGSGRCVFLIQAALTRFDPSIYSFFVYLFIYIYIFSCSCFPSHAQHCTSCFAPVYLASEQNFSVHIREGTIDDVAVTIYVLTKHAPLIGK